jgi:hypothetical protein
MLVITEILGNQPFSGSRVVINANFQSLKTEVESIESAFGMSISSGNIDVRGATGGQILGKTAAFNTLQLGAGTIAVPVVPNITLTGSTGTIVGKVLSIGTSATIPVLNVSTSIAAASLTVSGATTLNDLTKINNGLAYNKINLGTVLLPTPNTHTVLNSDRVLLFTLSAPGALSLIPDAALVDGHVVTLVDTSNFANTLLPTLIMGFATGSITFSGAGFKSSITLMWSAADVKWIIIGSSNMTII